MTWPDEPVWERCTVCKKEFAFPHLCREHSICGLCHPPLEESSDRPAR